MAHIIEPNGADELGIKHGYNMTPRRESAAELNDASFLRQSGHQVSGNQIAKLPETAEL
jgi:hypothetical protein